MARLTFPLSRIEGHAQVVIEVQAGDVVSAHFQAAEFRGFKYLVKGIPAEEMLVIVPRICGVCASAQHMAAVKTLEDAFDVTPTPLAMKIRELLLLGQMIQNQAISLFYFTMPDRLGTTSILPLTGAHGNDKERAALTQRALQVRKAGTELIRAAGGQFIHPVKAVIGGMTGGIDKEQAETLRDELEAAFPMACELFDLYIEKSFALAERIGTWGDDQPACYITSVGETLPNYCGDKVRLMGIDSSDYEVFPANDFRSYLTYEETDYSYCGKTHYRGEALRANSLARINMTNSMGTPRADDYLNRFREAFGQPAHAILLFDLARGIELVYGLERALDILREPLDQGEFQTDYKPQDGEGYGLVEAPRGPLIHHYVIEKGKIAQAEFVIPTVHNVMAIERALRVAAKRYINSERIDMELEQAVGRVVRAFDPCISCATL